MPAPVHARLRLGGALYGDASWSIGINIGSGQNGDPFANLSGDINQALDAWRDNVKGLNGGAILPGVVRGLMSAQANIQYVRCSRVGTDGKETNVSLVELGSAAAGTGSSYQDAQTACVFSLLTGRPGASYRGRVYLPALGATLSLGRLPESQPAQLATGLAGWLKDVTLATLDFGGVGSTHPVVVSTTRGVLTQITSVRVGNRLDSQRRRAEGQEEVYGVAAVPQ